MIPVELGERQLQEVEPRLVLHDGNGRLDHPFDPLREAVAAQAGRGVPQHVVFEEHHEVGGRPVEVSGAPHAAAHDAEVVFARVGEPVPRGELGVFARRVIVGGVVEQCLHDVRREQPRLARERRREPRLELRRRVVREHVDGEAAAGRLHRRRRHDRGAAFHLAHPRARREHIGTERLEAVRRHGRGDVGVGDLAVVPRAPAHLMLERVARHGVIVGHHEVAGLQVRHESRDLGRLVGPVADEQRHA